MTPGYELVDQRLRAAGINVSASEVHGLLSGLLCCGAADARAVWVAELFDDIGSSSLAVGECEALLSQIFQRAREEMRDPRSTFSLLLPADDRPLKQRALALVEWCQGFLYGIGLSGVAEGSFSGELREALADLGQITRMDQNDMEESEENEEAYMEIHEFVRVAAMLVREHMIAASENGI